jgi:hypothetical protein
MKPTREEPVKNGGEGDALLLGTSSWSDDDSSLKYARLDKRGHRSRGGELPISALPQAVRFAVREGYLTRKQTALLAKSLVDSLAFGS